MAMGENVLVYQFDITRERIRQIEAKTLSKLRHPSGAQKLRGYLAMTF